MIYGKKLNPILLVFFMVWIVAMGGALLDFNSHALRLNNIQSCILPVCFLFFWVLLRFRPQDMKPYWSIVCCLLLWQVALIVKFGSYDFLIGRFYDITFAFVLVRALGLRKMLYYYEVAVAKLSLLGLCLWILVQVIPMLQKALVGFSLPINETGTQVASWGIVGISNSENVGILRNLGFAWEPGRYASFVVLALMFHLYRTRFRLFQANFWPLFLGLFSSLSTTGYMAFMICIWGYYLNARRTTASQILKFLLPVVFFAIFIVFPFMLEKVLEISDTDNFITDNKVSYYGSIGYTYIPQRIEGLFYEALNIFNDPLLGYGDNLYYSYVQSVLFSQMSIRLSNGFLQIIAMLGIPLGLLFYWAIYRSSSCISRMYNIKGNYLIFLVICAVNISYNFFFEPFFVALALYCVFMPQSDKAIIFNQEYEKTSRSRPSVPIQGRHAVS